MNCIVVDDNELSRATIEDFVEDSPQLTLLDSFGDPVKALNWVADNEVDVIFLDVEMPKLTGIQFLQVMRDSQSSAKSQPEVVLITSHEKYAVDSYEFDVLDYLVKPVDYPRFLKAIGKASDRLQASAARDNRFLKIKCDGNLEIIPLEQVHFLKSNGNYLIVQTDSGRYVPKLTMNVALQELLPQEDFARAHKEYIVRLDQVKRVEANKFLIMNFEEKLIPLGEKYKKQVLDRLQSL